MAVHDFIPGISVTILSGRDAIVEHPDPDPVEVDYDHPDQVAAAYQAKRTVSSYIISEDNAAFGIKLSVTPPYKLDRATSKLGFEIKVDGRNVATVHCWRPRWLEAGEQWNVERTGVYEGKGHGCKEQEFYFAKIQTNSNALNVPEKAGTIEVAVWREDYGKNSGPTVGTTKGFLTKGGENVNEIALKGCDPKSHGTALGAAHKAKRGFVSSGNKKLDGDDNPILIFRFLYRSEDALRQLLILDPLPAASPLCSPSRSPSRCQSSLFVPPTRGSRSSRGAITNPDTEHQTLDIIRSLQEQIQALQDSVNHRSSSRRSDSRSIKHERGRTGSHNIKRERVHSLVNPRPARRQRQEVMTTITLDDDGEIADITTEPIVRRQAEIEAEALATVVQDG